MVIYLFSLWYVLQQPVEEPEKMTKIIVEALEITKQRGIINKGWGGLGNCESLYLPSLDLPFHCIEFILLNLILVITLETCKLKKHID